MPSNKELKLTKPGQLRSLQLNSSVRRTFWASPKVACRTVAVLAGSVPFQNSPMENRYTGVFEQVGDWWIGHVEELPGCNVQERSLEEAARA